MTIQQSVNLSLMEVFFASSTSHPSACFFNPEEDVCVDVCPVPKLVEDNDADEKLEMRHYACAVYGPPGSLPDTTKAALYAKTAAEQMVVSDGSIKIAIQVAAETIAVGEQGDYVMYVCNLIVPFNKLTIH